MNSWLQQLKNRYHWTNRIKVSSTSSFHCEGGLYRCHTIVDGKKNSVTVGSQSQIYNFDIMIVGDENYINIGANSYLEKDMVKNTGFLGE